MSILFFSPIICGSRRMPSQSGRLRSQTHYYRDIVPYPRRSSVQGWVETQHAASNGLLT
jgi:hypothetical protein